jgi:transaldolase
LALLLIGCATSAPPLPPDTSSVNRVRSIALSDFTPQDAGLSCEQIAEERRTNAAAVRDANAQIEANRKQNQVAGFIGAIGFAPAYLATEGNHEDKRRLVEIQEREDVLIKLASLKECLPASR